MFVENGHGQKYLNSTIRENKHQPPKTEKQRQQYRLLRVYFNYIIYIFICVEPQRNHSGDYCSS